jgi:hypothetical protein
MLLKDIGGSLQIGQVVASCEDHADRAVQPHGVPHRARAGVSLERHHAVANLAIGSARVVEPEIDGQDATLGLQSTDRVEVESTDLAEPNDHQMIPKPPPLPPVGVPCADQTFGHSAGR